MMCTRVDLQQGECITCSSLTKVYKHIHISFIHAIGAFYIYCNVEDLTDNSETLCETLLKDAKIAITPGTDFDVNRGKKFVRFSYAASTDIIQEGMNRLKAWYEKYHPSS